LRVEGVKKYFPIAKGPFSWRVDYIRAVDSVDLSLQEGQTLCLVGESGCGKTTLARLIVGLLPKDEGRIIFQGKDLDGLSRAEWRQLRRHIQMIFQDPYTSLNPRMRIGDIIREPLIIHRIGTRAQQKEWVTSILEQVGLSADHLGRYPHEFSGGQRQRIAIARALATRPRLIICDEPLSALDVSTQAQILQLFQDLQARYNLAYLIITHDLRLVRKISHQVAVMYLGKIVELAPVETFYASALHPYSRTLLESIPQPHPSRQQKSALLQAGEPTTPWQLATGCRFRPRCPMASSICEEEPPLHTRTPGHWVACHLVS